ncbi:UNVERIFIED_CONTAM: RING-H2 finger protein ATL60 [Sesamum latifolium]|uniref:RING-type E3 ubiquitin transferase n=1 Tax=Sesamum latifolium TaxID=2727402 RepID=A0AAW2UDK3_9LAMI
MGDSANGGGRLGNTGVIELTGKIMVVAIVLLFFVVFFVFCLHLYAKWFWYRRQENTTTTATRRRRRFDFAAGHQEIMVVSALRHGLDPSVLKTIPVIVFDPKEFRDGLECAVCLCEVSEGEKARLLPKCNHGFHVDCIDMWFQSHSTCPLCRNPVANQNQSNSAAESTLETILQAPIGENSGVDAFSTEAPNFPTNVLIWGNETQVSTLGPCVEGNHQGNATAEPSSSSSSSSMGSTSGRPDGISVIDIPRQINEEEEQKSPVPTRLRSLKRLLSGNRRVNPSSPRNLDVEQGGRGQS